jgi:hypothetical protein
MLGGDPMNPWIIRVIVIILAIALLPLVVNGVSALTVQAIKGVSYGINNLISPFSMRGDAKLEGLIRTCLYLIGITLMIKVLLGGRE